ncbi:MAG: hypothetical protein A2539_03910 [Elusimicrobia bacterium RIFOXYD2_FULL_34_15]|nr:MAG: hypothetical protein A2539_03910 [Elusimicrobia bacterium RIFOXYD2_FULL_34_15]
MNYQQSLKYVYNLGEFSYDFDLNRIKIFLEKLANPQDKLKIIHVAGTNGKGSVCAYISSTLQNAKYNVGLFTSPHISDIRERIQINRKLISKNEFSEFTTKFHKLANKYSLTYFEFLTAMAFWHFERRKVDFAVIEVGLGGRLDATNVVKNTLISIITNISLEHTQYLGYTIKKISGEKSGIIKNNGTVITGSTGIALKTIKEFAKKKNAAIFPVKITKKYKLPLFGNHQQQNASIAAKCAQILNISNKNIQEGLKKTNLPGRFEVRQFPPLRLWRIRHRSNGENKFKIIVDVAHNPAGMLVLKDSIKKYFNKKLNFVFGVLKDKDYKNMIKNISPIANKVFISAPKIKRALKPETVKNEFIKYIPIKNVFVYKDIKSATKSAVNSLSNFCITGSFYTVSEAIKCLRI